MNTVIQQKVESIEVINQQMKEIVSQTISSILKEFAQTEDNPVSGGDEVDDSNFKNSIGTIGIVSGAALLAGAVGWIACGATWSKILFGFGLGLGSSIFLNKNKRSTNPSFDDKSDSEQSISKQKLSACQKIMSTIDAIIDLWENHTRTNNDQLLELIEKSTLSSNDKFNASSFITVTKTLDFELLKLQNQIDDAKSIEELKKAISLIHDVIKDKIDEVSKLQVEAYRQVDKIMMGE